ncbi:rab-like protein 3 [Rhopilema esculentum]|uniref:rab-like protein 3 n=1 Tax=Rhopilema esculentum TaxID=499914 RepID=UPI0031DCF7DC|eukprot:gene17673-9327_t
MSGSIEKVRIAVLGDSGVGKTSLVHALAHGEVLPSAPWTIGCSVEVLLYEYQQGSSSEEKSIYIELWDVGGSTSHKNSRSIFYNNVNGVILVHDLSNKKSIQNLRKWFAELLNCGKQDFTGVIVRGSSPEYNGSIDFDLDQFSGNQLPVLIVGTKLDQAPETRASSSYCSLAGELRATQVNLDCLQKKSFSIGSQNWDKFSSFFDKVIERKSGTRHNLGFTQTSFDSDSPRSLQTDKRRKGFSGFT